MSPERGASHVDIRPRLNSFTQLYTVANAGADVLRTLSNSALISFGVKPFIYRCLITARNSFFSSLQKIQRLFALIVYRNETTRWIPLKILSAERCYLSKSNVTLRVTDFLRTYWFAFVQVTNIDGIPGIRMCTLKIEKKNVYMYS